MQNAVSPDKLCHGNLCCINEMNPFLTLNEDGMCLS